MSYGYRRRYPRRRSQSYSTTPPTHSRTVPASDDALRVNLGPVDDASRLFREYREGRHTGLFNRWISNRSESWCAAFSDEQAEQALIEGVEPEDATIPEVDTSWLPAAISTDLRQTSRWGVGAGAAWNMGALIAGAPRYAMKFTRAERQAPVVTLVVSATVSSGIPASELIKRAAAIVATVRDIQTTGRSVRVFLSADVRAGSRTHHARALVKDADEPIDTARLYWWLGHPAALRMVVYPWVETGLAGGDPDKAGGHLFGHCNPIDPVPWEDDEAVVTIGCVSWADPNWRESIRAKVVAAFNTEDQAD